MPEGGSGGGVSWEGAQGIGLHKTEREREQHTEEREEKGLVQTDRHTSEREKA